MPLISVCIPAYNRPAELSDLLESVTKQNYDNYEIVICEDHSPLSEEIEKVTKRFSDRYPELHFKFKKNSKNLGYDANLRELLLQAEGDYCFFMGDDDVMMSGSLSKVAQILQNYDEIGVILRSWLSIERNTKKVVAMHKYFESDRLFPPGEKTVITFFRRSVFISGYIVHRGEALKFNTARFDGSLLYQLYLTANVLLSKNGFYIADFLTANMSSGRHYFGSAETEKFKFKPGVTLPEHSIGFMKGMLEIAMSVEEERKVKIYNSIVKDLSNYAYGYLQEQAHNKKNFISYVLKLAKLGLGRSLYFWLTAVALLLLGKKNVDRIIFIVQKVLGRTPLLSKVYSGEKIDS